MISNLCAAIAFRTQIGAQSLEEYIRGELVGRIDEITDMYSSRPARPLSELLASCGILPMFGFPTR